MYVNGNIVLSVLYLIIAINYIILFYIPTINLHNSSRILVYISIILHLCFLLFVTITQGRFALTTVFEVLSMLALLMTILLISLEIKTGEKSLGAFIFPLVFSLQIISILGKRIPILDESVIQMPLLSLHTLTTVIGYTFFIYSFILAIMYLYLLKRFKKKKYDNVFFNLPPLDVLEKLNVITLFSGFILLTIGLITGGCLAILVWDYIPIQDPKILLTILLWFIYLVNILARFLFKLKGKSMSYTSIIGFFLIVIIIMLEGLTKATLHRF